jgi:hypothetical protein
VDNQFEEGRTTSVGDDELELIMAQVDNDSYIALCHHRRDWLANK